jgi:hypothetical protein
MSRDRSDIKVTASDALEFEPVETAVKRPSRRGLKWTIALVVLIGVGAGAWFVYGDKLMMLTGSSEDEVPLLRADTGPVKVRPENPGGLQVPNRDKLVYNRLSGETSEGQPVERLLPRAEAPLPVPTATTEAPAPAATLDLPPKSAAPKPNPVPAQPKTERVPALSDVAAVQPPPPPPAPPSATSGRAGAPLSLTKRSPAPATAAAAQPAPPARPVPRVSAAEPLRAATTPPPPSAPAPASASATQSAAVTTPAQAVQASSSYRVQLAASRTPEGVRAEWDRVRRKNLDLLGDLGLTVTRVDLGPKKGVFYRLRVGPLASDAEAHKLCAELAKRRIGCLVIKPGA